MQVMCLQEVEEEHYHSLYLPQLQSNGSVTAQLLPSSFSPHSYLLFQGTQGFSRSGQVPTAMAVLFFTPPRSLNL